MQMHFRSWTSPQIHYYGMILINAHSQPSLRIQQRPIKSYVPFFVLRLQNGDKVSRRRFLNTSMKQVRNVLSKHGSFILALSTVLDSVSRLLHCVLRSLDDSDCWLAVTRSKPSRLFEVIARTAHAKRVWQVIKHKITFFFLRLLHQRACTRGCCASPYLPTSRKLESSTWQSRTVNYCSTVTPTNQTIARTQKRWMRACAYCGTVRKWKRLYLRTTVQRNGT